MEDCSVLYLFNWAEFVKRARAGGNAGGTVEQWDSSSRYWLRATLCAGAAECGDSRVSDACVNITSLSRKLGKVVSTSTYLKPSDVEHIFPSHYELMTKKHATTHPVWRWTMTTIHAFWWKVQEIWKCCFAQQAGYLTSHNFTRWNKGLQTGDYKGMLYVRV